MNPVSILPAPRPLAAYMALPQHPPTARIAYGEAPSQVIDLFLPAGDGPHPVAILLHGGCWRREYEGLRQVSGIAADLASRGVAVWNVEYRGVDEPGGGYPGTFQDVATAMDLIRTEAVGFSLDPNRTVAVGHSAGGHLALWAAARPHLPADSILRSSDPLSIGAVVSLGGVGDLEGHEEVSKMVCGYDRDILLGARPEPFADTSPAALLPIGVKAVMIHGAYDYVFPPYVGLDYARKARDAGDAVEMVVVPDAGHYDVVMVGTLAWEIVADRILAEIAALP